MKETLLATGGALSALGASSCCILPIGLALAGAGGAWGANLQTLAAYQPWFIVVAVVFLGAGFWTVYGQSAATCQDGSCRRANSSRFIKGVLLVKIVLWIGAALVAFTGLDFGAHLFFKAS